MKKVLYLGDGPKNGPACYLLGVLKYAGFSVSHVEPCQTLSSSLMKKKYSLIILSDYSRHNLKQNQIKWIENAVKNGTNFLMIGGWCSFNGFGNGYKGSVIEKILPVTCLNRDDRRNLASGAVFDRARVSHSALKKISLKPSPVLIGYNEVRKKQAARVLLGIRENERKKKSPLLVIGHFGNGTTAAWTSDLAPHWCGGLLDWGKKRLKLKVDQKIGVEVGETYVKFFSLLLKWPSGKGKQN